MLRILVTPQQVEWPMEIEFTSSCRVFEFTDQKEVLCLHIFYCKVPSNVT